MLEFGFSVTTARWSAHAENEPNAQPRPEPPISSVLFDRRDAGKLPVSSTSTPGAESRRGTLAYPSNTGNITPSPILDSP